MIAACTAVWCGLHRTVIGVGGGRKKKNGFKRVTGKRGGLLAHTLALRQMGQNCHWPLPGLLAEMKGEDVGNPERFGGIYSRLKIRKHLFLSQLHNFKGNSEFQRHFRGRVVWNSLKARDLGCGAAAAACGEGEPVWGWVHSSHRGTADSGIIGLYRAW